MRCARIHDPAYCDACMDWAAAHFDVVMDPDRKEALIDRAQQIVHARLEFHGAKDADFCFDFGCDQWGTDNRWSERERRVW